MRRIAVFSGTTEGRELSVMLSERAISHIVCVAGEYGREMMSESPYACIHTGRMDATEMVAYLQAEGYGTDSLLIDATHPYAKEATVQIRKAADVLGCEYRRVVRTRSELSSDGADRYPDMAKCAKAVDRTEGNILLTTGSKELSAYCREVSEETRKRTYVRVLPSIESILLCKKEGISSDHIIAMQGPFSINLNRSLMEQYRIRHLVTKESGDAGGLREKETAAKLEGVRLHVIERPDREEGEGVLEVFQSITKTDSQGEKCKEKTQLPEICQSTAETDGQGKKCKEKAQLPKVCQGTAETDGKGKECTETTHITLVGCGMGSRAGLTLEAVEAISRADIVFGAGRLLRGIHAKRSYEMYRGEEIIPVLEREKPERAVILFSGDSGFYSGTSDMVHALRKWREDVEICVLPGISAVSYLAAKLKVSYEDALLFSLHGRNCEAAFGTLAGEVRFHEKAFVLLSGTQDVPKVAEYLINYGIEAQICVGINLSGEQESIECLSLKEALSWKGEGIASILILNRKPERRELIPVIQDADLVRSSIPMTKECVRHESIIRLKIREGDLVYDIGGGTGSVAIEAASLHPGVCVFSIEKGHEAAELIRENVRKMRTGNVTVIEQEAAEALSSMPKPDCVFIGGSSGRLLEIMEILCSKGKGIRYVVNAVSLETIGEVRQVLEKYRPQDECAVVLSVSDIRKAGEHHMMHAQNPVTVFSFTI